MAASPEKFDLLSRLAQAFNSSPASRRNGCAFVRLENKSSGAAASLLADGWPDPATNGPRPAAWSPAASAWGAILNQRLADRGQPAEAPGDAKPLWVTPLTIAMPKPMAEALGYPRAAIGYGDLVSLARDANGWGSRGHPEWGPFRLGKTNPNLSTSALNATIAQYYAATGKVRDLTLEDAQRPDVAAYNRSVESAVVHYGDTTLTFLANLLRNDARGAALTYVSAVAVEEKSVLDYNRGIPSGAAPAGETPRPPRVPLVAVYPKEGTLLSDNPFYVLDAPWASPQAKTAARAFESFLQDPASQRRALAAGFRPGNPAVGLGDPIVAANGVDPAQPQTTLGVPAPQVLVRLVQKWSETRKGARVLMAIDVSGSMGDEAAPGRTKLDLVKDAAVRALEQFNADDQVGLRIFSTAIGPADHPDYADVVPIGPLGPQKQQLAAKIGALLPAAGTPLYTVTNASYDQLKAGFDGARINAVLLLTDGKNEDPRNSDLEALIRNLRAGSEGQSATPVRVFTIGYGHDADLATLRRISDATNASTYDASDPTTIDRVFTAVVSNF
jgi:Ca-activated chloride channel family protein